MSLELKGLGHSFDPKGIWALKDVNLKIPASKATVLIGPSGEGKTTLLKIIAGQLRPNSGEVLYQGVPTRELSAQDIAFIPQEWSLVKEQNVFDYLSLFALGDEQEKHHLVRAMVELFHLQGEAKKTTHQLSTGQKARVFLAGHLLNRPSLVLLDEPFAHLDRPLRRELESELYEVLRAWDCTSVLVTHNLDEAFERSESMLLMIEGKIYQVDPEELYCLPVNASAARFCGEVNLIASKVIKKEQDWLSVKNNLGEFRLQKEHPKLLAHTPEFVYLFFRPEAVSIESLDGSGEEAKVIAKELRGAFFDYKIQSRSGVILSARTWSWCSEFNLNEKIKFKLYKDALKFLPV